MPLLAAFVAMLGKRWLNRYLLHTRGSTVERCGDRQLEFNSLEKWPFRIFIESLEGYSFSYVVSHEVLTILMIPDPLA